MLLLVNSLLIGASFLLSIILLLNPTQVNRKGNRWFGFFVLALFLILLENFIISAKLVSLNDVRLEWLSLSNFVIAPLLFMSVSYFVEPLRQWKNKDLWHFSLGIFLLILMLIHLFFPQDTLENETQTNDNTQIVLIVFSVIFGSQILIYSGISYLKIVRHQKKLLFFSSNTTHQDLHELKNISIVINIMALIWLADIFFYLSENYPWFDLGSSFIDLGIIVYMAINWLKQKEIFPYNNTEKLDIESVIQSDVNSIEPKRKLLDEAKLEFAKKELLQLMSSQKPYLNPDLSLFKLAESLQLTPHVLSYILNEGIGQNFYTFVNTFRINEAKQLITDPKMTYLNLLGIAFEVGFNSKTSFNTAFKKITGMTPSEFKSSKKLRSDL